MKYNICMHTLIGRYIIIMTKDDGIQGVLLEHTYEYNSYKFSIFVHWMHLFNLLPLKLKNGTHKGTHRRICVLRTKCVW